MNHCVSLLEGIKLIEEATGKKAAVNLQPSRLGDLKYFVCDISKAKRELGWEPTIRPKEGIPLLVDWIKENEKLFREG